MLISSKNNMIDNENTTKQIDELKAVIGSSNDETLICDSYRILGDIGEQNKIDELTNHLIVKFVAEKNKTIKESIHNALRKQVKNKNTHVKPLLDILEKYKKSDIIESVIALLHNAAANAEVEFALIKILENSHSDWIYKRVNNCLHTSGSRESIPYLIKKIHHKSNDVAISSIITIIRLGDHRESELFCTELTNGKIKDTAMEGIVMHCGIEAVDAVIERLKKKTGRKRETDCSSYFYSGNENETTLGLKFLHQFKDDRKDITDFFLYLLNKRKDKLFDYEIAILNEVINDKTVNLTKRNFK